MNASSFDSTNLRQRAEAQLSETGVKNAATPDPRRLLHELQVHQIELELQNEELLAANRELEALRRPYEALFEHAPVGYLTLALDGAVLSANQRALEMLKRDSEALLGSRLGECFDPQSLVGFTDLVATASHDGPDALGDNLLVRRPHSVPIYIKAQCRKLVLDDGQTHVILLAIMDVSALKFAVDDVVSRLDV